MTHLQGGAESRGGSKFQTKKSLKELVQSEPTAVMLYSTGLGGPQFNGNATRLEAGQEFLVVGPDPYTKRNWYATIYRKKSGALAVK
jgi:hypothetical protein